MQESWVEGECGFSWGCYRHEMGWVWVGNRVLGWGTRRAQVWQKILGTPFPENGNVREDIKGIIPAPNPGLLKKVAGQMLFGYHCGCPTQVTQVRNLTVVLFTFSCLAKVL